MMAMPEGFLGRLANLCRQYGVLLLADEVATGFGRTGRMFACDHEGVEPDIMAIGKGLTGGYLPVAATLTTDRIYDAFLGEHAQMKTFFHGHSFTGNQLGCAVALASLDLFESDRLVERVQASAAQVADLLKPVAELAHAGDVRQRGLMVGIELVEEKAKASFPWEQATGARVCRRARDLGMITRPLGDVVVFMPPLVTGRKTWPRWPTSCTRRFGSCRYVRGIFVTGTDTGVGKTVITAGVAAALRFRAWTSGCASRSRAATWRPTRRATPCSCSVCRDWTTPPRWSTGTPSRPRLPP